MVSSQFMNAIMLDGCFFFGFYLMVARWQVMICVRAVKFCFTPGFGSASLIEIILIEQERDV